MFWNKLIPKLMPGAHSANRLVANRREFEDFVYTESLSDALSILNDRRKDKSLKDKIEKYLSDVRVPEPFRGDPRLVIFRQVATPNIEISRFLIAADGAEVKPLFIEYFEDKFTSNNDWKKYLGKLAFYDGVGKKGGHKVNYHTIIDFNKFNGEKISEVKTIWGGTLASFHHSLFTLNYGHVGNESFFDASDWFKKCGGTPKKYYIKLLTLYILHGIAFENFLLEDKAEHEFAEKVFLPALKEVRERFGVKPLIVPLSPTNIETAEFWLCHNPKTKEWFEKTMII